METLAVKYRPQTFEDVVEQDNIKKILMNQLNNGIRNAYLFCGPAGCGKTTNGRLFAKAINNGDTSNLVELDAASHSGVEDVRKLIADSKFKPVGCKYRVFIIDECFTPDTPIRTPKGTMPIKDIREGDEIYNMCGKTTVKKVFKNSVSRDRLVCVRVNGTDIVTTSDHLFFTENGWVESHNLKEGDVLFDYTELCDMWERVPMLSKRWQEDMFKRMYCEIQDTTGKGDLHEEESTSDESMSCVREGVPNISFNTFKNMWKRMLHYLQETEWIKPEAKESILKASARIHLSCMWEEFHGENIQKSKILFDKLHVQISKNAGTEPAEDKYCYGLCMCYMWQAILRQLSWKKKDMFQRVSSDIVQDIQRAGVLRETPPEYETPQSVKESRSYTEDERDKGEEWDTSCVAWETWWKWSVDGTTEDASPRVAITARRMEDRICSTHKDGEVQWLPHELQTRPCLTGEDDWCGSGWQEPFVEKWVVEGCKESEFIRNTRVESVEVYKPGYNDELFKCCFPDTGSDSEFVTLYDLEVEGHNSYFANDILVHNCHSLSNTAWQSFLKCLEEPTPTSVFILCTTDPQKIPKTIISRVQQFDFSKITHTGIVNRLKYIIDKENEQGNNYTYDEDSISYIAKLAEGGMRSAITLMEKTLGLNDRITMETVVASIGVLKHSTMFDLTDYLCKMDRKNVIQTVEDIHKSGFDLKLFIKNYTDFVLDLCKYDLFQDFDNLFIPNTYEDRIKRYERQDFEFFLDLLNSLIQLGNSIKWDPTPKPLIESTLLLLCTEG